MSPGQDMPGVVWVWVFRLGLVGWGWKWIRLVEGRIEIGLILSVVAVPLTMVLRVEVGQSHWGWIMLMLRMGSRWVGVGAYSVDKRLEYHLRLGDGNWDCDPMHQGDGDLWWGVGVIWKWCWRAYRRMIVVESWNVITTRKGTGLVLGMMGGYGIGPHGVPNVWGGDG